MPYFVSALDPQFPSALREGSRPAAGLWVQGTLPPPTLPLVAMVGSRAASGRGCEMAAAWAQALTESGRGVISGGALGIDAAAHRGALAGSGLTYAVLGCGVDVTYPDRHGPLFQQICARGALLSEYPPGHPPRSGQFPVRNRLIVGWSSAVVVIEARLRSGALVTARLAHKSGRRLLAVPGTSGTDALLDAGLAWPVSAFDQLMAGLAGQQSYNPFSSPPAKLAPLVSAIQAGMQTPAALSLYLGQPFCDVIASLMEAEIEGWVSRRGGNRYEVTHGH